MKRALITGISGQDGSYLAEYLLELGYEVAGIIRRTSNSKAEGRLSKQALEKIKIYYGDMTDTRSLEFAITDFKPTEVYNLAAQSFVGLSWEQPFYTTETNAVGALNLLSIIKSINKDIKYYQASTSELFGKTEISPQNESTPFHPRSPYGVSKLYAHWMTVNYRESYDMFTCSGILFNHESPRRGEEFITKKITSGIARIIKGDNTPIKVGNICTKRDWGYAPDYVKAMQAMLQKDVPSDYVIATNETHTIKEFIQCCFDTVNMIVSFEDEKVVEINGKVLIEVDRQLFRPAEVYDLRGDYSKAKKELNWEPSVRFKELVKIMIEHEMKEL